MDTEALLQQIATLKKTIDAHVKTIDAHVKTIDLQQQEIRLQQFEIKRWIERYYGRKRERYTGLPQPLLPFEEANESAAIEPAPHASEAPDDEEKQEITYTRRKPRRMEKLPSDLPRDTVELHPSAEDLICKDCHGEKSRIGQEKTEKLNYKPASFFVAETIRHKYACRNCEQNVSIAPLPPQAIDRGLPGSGLLAHVLVSKYGDHLPLHRQAEMYRRQGVEISKSTMCEWVAAETGCLGRVVGEMHQKALLSYCMQTDDTAVVYLDPNAKGGSRKGYIWVYVGDEGEVVYDFTTGHGSDGPEKFLKGYRGYLQADAHPVYDPIFTNHPIFEVGCWAHARRNFFDAKDFYPTECGEMLGMIGELYQIEREAKERNLTFGEREKLRLERSVSVLDKIKRWLDEKENKILPKSPLGEAIKYCKNQWTALTRYAIDGRLNIDNNPAERALRTVAVGRKNWMFAGSEAGGERAAIAYSIIYTCKRIGINPFEYLKDVLDRIPSQPGHLLWELTPRGWRDARAKN